MLENLQIVEIVFWVCIAALVGIIAWKMIVIGK